MHLSFDEVHDICLRVNYGLAYHHGVNHGILIGYRNVADLLVEYRNVSCSTDQFQICVAEFQNHSVFCHCKRFSFSSK